MHDDLDDMAMVEVIAIAISHGIAGAIFAAVLFYTYLGF